MNETLEIKFLENPLREYIVCVCILILGFLLKRLFANVVSKHFKWVAKHEQINRDIKFNTKSFVGCDGINETENINLYNDNTFMFQSHIAGDWNDNVWSEDNFNHFQMVIDYLKSQYDLNFVTISELI